MISDAGAGGPNGLCILEPEPERCGRDRPLNLVAIGGIGEARNPVAAPAAKAIRLTGGRPMAGCAEQRQGVHQGRMIATRSVAAHDQASPEFGRDVFARNAPNRLLSHGSLPGRTVDPDAL